MAPNYTKAMLLGKGCPITHQGGVTSYRVLGCILAMLSQANVSWLRIQFVDSFQGRPCTAQ